MRTSLGHWKATATHHSPAEDVQGIGTGVVAVALGVAILSHLGFLTGGTAGLSLVISYATGWSFGLVFFLINLPFYLLSIRRLGMAFTLKTFAAIAALSLLTSIQPGLLQFGEIDPLYGAVVAGLLMGFGLLALFRHRASLGGVGILAIYMQDRFGFRAGLVQLAFDLVILALSFTVASPTAVIYSVIGATLLNLFLAINHRSDRYIAM